MTLRCSCGRTMLGDCLVCDHGALPLPVQPKRRPNACFMPRAADPRDAIVYERIRERVVRSHCDAGRGPHLCCGRVTIDRLALTLNCPLCGDARLTLGDQHQNGDRP